MDTLSTICSILRTERRLYPTNIRRYNEVNNFIQIKQYQFFIYVTIINEDFK